MTEEEIRNNMRSVADAGSRRDTTYLMVIATEMLVRLVAAQEAIVHFANLDLEAQIEEAIKSRSEERAAEIVAEKTQRTYIGRKS